MSENNLDQRIVAILNSNKKDLLKKLSILAVVSSEFQKYKSEIILVGGEAVEFYTSGGYTTGDIDILTEADQKTIENVFESLGFKKEQKYWTIKNNELIYIEIPAGPLSGDRNRVNKIKIGDNLSINIINVNDLIIDRINRYVFWKEYKDKEWIIGMMQNNEQYIDIPYLRKVSKEEDTLETLEYFLNMHNALRSGKYVVYNKKDIINLVCKKYKIDPKFMKSDISNSIMNKTLTEEERINLEEKTVFFTEERMECICEKIYKTYIEEISYDFVSEIQHGNVEIENLSQEIPLENYDVRMEIIKQMKLCKLAPEKIKEFISFIDSKTGGD